MTDLSQNDRVIIRPDQYTEIQKGIGDQFILTAPGGSGICTPSGQVILPLEYESIELQEITPDLLEESETGTDAYTSQCYLVRTADSTGIVDAYGETILMGTYRYIEMTGFVPWNYGYEDSAETAYGYITYEEHDGENYCNWADKNGKMFLEEPVACDTLSWDGHGFVLSFYDTSENDGDFQDMEDWAETVAGYADRNGKIIIPEEYGASEVSWDGHGYQAIFYADDESVPDDGYLLEYLDKDGEVLIDRRTGMTSVEWDGHGYHLWFNDSDDWRFATESYMTEDGHYIVTREEGASGVSWDGHGYLVSWAQSWEDMNPVVSYINEDGETLISKDVRAYEIEWDGLGYVLSFKSDDDSEWFDTYKGYADMYGNLIIGKNAHITSIERFDHMLLYERSLGEGKGCMDLSGQTIIEPGYNDIVRIPPYWILESLSEEGLTYTLADAGGSLLTDSIYDGYYENEGELCMTRGDDVDVFALEPSEDAENSVGTEAVTEAVTETVTEAAGAVRMKRNALPAQN